MAICPYPGRLEAFMIIRILLLASALPVLIVSAVGCSSKTGTLEGKAMISPRPLEQLGQPYPNEVYQPRKVMVYNADRTQLIKQVDIDSQGYYRVQLPAGAYTIDINYFQSDRSDGAPRKLKIVPDQSVMFDIDFDIQQ